MQSRKKKDIRIKADAFRENCKVSHYGIIDLFKEVERCGYKLMRYPLGNEETLGFTLKRDEDIIIFTNTCARLSREIFTLAHELGHAVLHMEFGKSFLDDDITISGKSTDEMEQEANYFAACLLMPSECVERFLDLEILDFEKRGLAAMDIARMMSEFSVSFDTVLNRLETLGKIDGIQKEILDSEKNQMRVGNLLRCVGGNSRLNERTTEISIPYEYIDYVIYNYNHNAIPRETLERVLECCHLSYDDIKDRLKEREQENEDLDELIGGLED